MNLQTQISFRKADKQIDYASELMLLGSCFSEHIGAKLDYFKFRTLQNPFGILFHPLAIENLITRAIQKRGYTPEDLFYHNERWHCFDAHSNTSNLSKEKVLEGLNGQLRKTEQLLSKASHIIITLGTGWTYQKRETGVTVANCHKIPQKEFKKQLLTVDEITASLQRTIQQIRTVNKNAELVFTISPVRHLKDGFVENQRSKAHLIAAVHDIVNAYADGEKSRVAYFESYELMMDELRDYRFYKADMIHPNTLAIDYIWEKFSEVWVSDDAQVTMELVEEIQRGLDHRPFNPNSEQHQKFRESLKEKISYIKKEHPAMTF
ncbi:GSCFA domain-containing protein [Maribacter sp. MJ134]|uniref:GSCFA domain-containing protein n=1 Tax=Maribacter sp. MJ134 TaxID=2496865 RepID=UPI000F81FEEE|nr:GSCFA domain-containing protein [Maribacter sp. MJ134]AZQ60388.1 GSCFA domain-containing protein [Maribacter sp. MJ134]